MQSILSVSGVSKTYASGHKALDHVDLDIRKGEIFALLGPNGAGKTTLINIICGIVTPSSGTITVDGYDAIRQPREARSKIGLVPQEIAIDIFTNPQSTLRFSRGLFGKPPNHDYIDQVLKDLTLWDKRSSKLMELSGGMKRRVMIGKALSHEPDILFLDEPTAGVDVSLRREMWKLVLDLRERGTTIILTTHYIEEAEEMADRVGVIDKGKLLLVEDKKALMKKMGKREMRVNLAEKVDMVPAGLEDWQLSIEDEGHVLLYSFDAQAERTGIPSLLRRLTDLGIGFTDLDTSKSSLEDIFVGLVEQKEVAA
jgi:ABC-2 type transport system ATP-binding protein